MPIRKELRPIKACRRLERRLVDGDIEGFPEPPRMSKALIGVVVEVVVFVEERG